LVYDQALAVAPSIDITAGYTCPPALSIRSYMVPASNQGATSDCAGFAVGGYIEPLNWRHTHIAKQFDGHAIANRSRLTNRIAPNDGMSIPQAFRAAQDLKMLSSRLKLHTVDRVEDIKFALHKYGVLVGGLRITKGWNSCDTTTGRMPDSNVFIGGHGIDLTGYNDYGLELLNSWDLTWGDQGFAWLSWKQARQQFLYACVME